MEISELINNLTNKLQKIDSSIESLIDFEKIINLIKDENREVIEILFKTITNEKCEYGFVHDNIILELSNFYLNENNAINAGLCLGKIKNKTNQSFVSTCLDIVERYSNLLTEKRKSIGQCCFGLTEFYPSEDKKISDNLTKLLDIIHGNEINEYLVKSEEFVNEIKNFMEENENFIKENNNLKIRITNLKDEISDLKTIINDIININDNYRPLYLLYGKKDESNPNIFIVDDKETMKSIIKSYFSLASKAIEYISSNDGMQPETKDLMLDMIIMKIGNTINSIEGDFSEVNGNNEEKVDEFKEFYNTGIIVGISIGNANYLTKFETNPAIINMAKVFEKKGSDVGLEIFTKFYLNNKEKFKNDYKNSLKLRYDLNKNDHFAAEFYLDFLIEENLYESIDELKNILIELKQRIELLGKDNPNYNTANGEIVRTFDKIIKQFSKKEEKEDISELKETFDSFADLYEGGIKYVGENNTKNVYDYIISEQKFFEEYWKLVKNSSKREELESFSDFANMIENRQRDIGIPECNIISFLNNVESTMIEESRIKHGPDIEKIEQSLSINGLVEYFNKLCAKKNVNKEKIKSAFNYIIEKTSEIDDEEVPNTDKHQIILFLTNLLNKNEIDLSLIKDNKEILEKLVGNYFSTYVEEILKAKKTQPKIL